MKKLIALAVFAASLVGAQTTIPIPGNSGTDIQIQRITSTEGACTGMMSVLMQPACQTIQVTATSKEPNVIGFLFVMLYTNPLGQMAVITQSSFLRETSGFSTAFPALGVTNSIGAMPLTAAAPVKWVTNP